MAIASTQATRFTKVRIPSRKTAGGPLAEFLAVIVAEWKLPYLIVGGYRNAGNAWLTYENNYYLGNDYTIEGYDFCMADLELFEPDAEALNPTSHPLSAEELADHLHGQGEKTVLAEWNGIKFVADLECPVYADPAKDAEKTWEEEGESILANAKSQAQFAPLKAVLDGFEAIMRYKNAQYGNTGLEPVGVFSKGDTLEKLLSRADDKVARIKNSPMLRKNDCVDLMGYLVLICAHQGWHDFTDQQD